MDPVRLPASVLAEKARELGDYGYAGQYGQDPRPAGGGLFKTDLIGWGDDRIKYKRIVRFWDKASTSSASPKARKAAWTVGVMMAEDLDGFFWVLDVVRVRVDTFSRERLIHRTAMRDTRKVVVGVEQEGASGGVDSAKTTVRRLAGFSVVVSKARQNKEARAYNFSVQVNQGLLRLPDRLRQDGRWVGWAKEFTDELAFWPFSTFRDQGDAASGAFNLLWRGRLTVGPIGRKAGKRRGTLVLGRRKL
jgi:predicted phage terminase large subunit-like protein